jgi:hypothetical protein
MMASGTTQRGIRTHVFIIVHWWFKIKITEIHGHVFAVGHRNGIVEDDFDS